MKSKEKYTKHNFKRLSLKIGNYYDGFQIIEIKNNDNYLIIEGKQDNSDKISFSAKLNIKYDDFFNDLQNINIEHWESEYKSELFTGYEWNFRYFFKPSVIIEKKGSNNFPQNFVDLIDFIKRFYSDFNADIEIRKTLNEQDLTKLYCFHYDGTSFFEVSVGKRNSKSTDRRIDIVRIENDIYKWQFKYSDNKEKFLKLIKSKRKIEIVEVKTKLNRGVIGQIIVGEYLFKKKFKIDNFVKTILCHIGDELLEEFCKDNDINLIKY